MTDTQWEVLSNQAITVAGVVYFLALLSHLVEWAGLRQVPHTEEVTTGRTALFGRLGLLLTGLGGLVHFVALLGRGMAADPNRVPWGNMYEFSISGAWFVVVIYLATYKKFKLSWLAPLVVATVLTVLMFAVIWLHKPVAPLTEALDSPWLVIHVVSAVIATAAFTLGGLLVILFLVQERIEKKDAERGVERTTGYFSRVPSTKVLDRLAYRMHAFGFPVWTFAVLITGPIWAHEAWSRYWNWDPKEVWAFITWVVYAAYLHARTTAGLRGKVASVLALIGLATLWWSFIGVNFFSTTSQHSYAEGASQVQLVPVDSSPVPSP
ncbi:c-type cytochrome biogenesis protein CcsB [Nocardioides daphniae]|uniref:Cytochrome c assembly protein domain-containing protein n=1 Tax=Nocardioides daphniae TaxID=402297 RepID=A0ABQ1Q9U6_9ACTN|nr:c-type cytochrome biogenesis protein CcsB [Nocardioides daphniae]GGD20456.1 hypothetical protein GCM10007231_19500 [Nocardioides daphniae]